MTGFGRVSRTFGNFTATVEIKSLNSRSLDLKVKVPSSYREKELELRRIINNDVQRGKVDFTLEVTSQEGTQDVQIQSQVFRTYYRELNALADEFSIPKGDLLYTITRLPNVIVTRDELVGDDEWEQVQNVVSEAITAFKRFRLDDGKALEEDFRLRVKIITECLENVEVHEPGRAEKVRARLAQNLDEVTRGNIDDNRLEQEIVFYLEKFDITEEKIRLKQHCEYFLSELDTPDEGKGRKLNFIVQEMGREINTIGSKANSADIQRLVVVMKDELEKVKEQLANIL